MKMLKKLSQKVDKECWENLANPLIKYTLESRQPDALDEKIEVFNSRYESIKGEWTPDKLVSINQLEIWKFDEAEGKIIKNKESCN